MTFTMDEITYENFGRCIAMSNGAVSVFVTVDCGPRIIYCGLKGQQNLFFTDTERSTSRKGTVFDQTFGPGSVYHFLGGHRLWTSPENEPLSYYPDNKPVVYRKTESGAVFTPPAQRVNCVQHELEVRFGEGAFLEVLHRITNTADHPQTFAPWAITQLAPGGLEIIPQTCEDTGLLPNRVLSLWPYTDFTDPRLYVGRRFVTVQQDPFNLKAFKLGLNNPSGWAAYLNKGTAFIKRFDPWLPQGNYPDFGVNFETYTSNYFMECETVGELQTLSPGDVLTHTERWELRSIPVLPNRLDEGSLDLFVARYIL